ncbi:SGNH hydrolase-type esterase domain-containing protein [Podospora aff. communis PSN243]|uniref:SGNH hydrolase-type esterase domain-containing protein n=1 Tax=Podospora aff. communis PSN243 TaxID=3040156 RepID=A0AAV9GJA3_9PEZI|nr:SGNH hydrolase-type esterase domain-containing protein [Podospora aff. communis PSN243]
MVRLRFACHFTALLALVGHGVQQNAPYDDYSWITRMGIVGDSYTAGIGAGTADPNSGSCKRYSGSWATRMTGMFNRLGGGSIFNYACSGAKTPDISRQIARLPGNLDLVVLTAGGNDLCLNALITNCIMSPLATNHGCQEIVRLAQTGLNTYFEENVRTLLEELLPKMRPQGVIILAGYAQFFDATTDACTDENWTFGSISGRPSLPLTRSLRAQMNEMVIQTNIRLARAARRMDRVRNNIRVGFADWDAWPSVLRGRFCERGMDPDPKRTPTLQFIKRDTHPLRIGRLHDELRRRDGEDNSTEPEFPYELARQEAEAWIVNFVANATSPRKNTALQSRAITEPNCPGGINLFGDIIPIPDFLGSLFHPTLLGHQAMMTFALNRIRSIRAQQLGIPGPGCSDHDADCVGIPANSVPYTSRQAVESELQAFCTSAAQFIQRGSVAAPFRLVREYHSRTPDHVRIVLSFDATFNGGRPRPQDFSVNTCVETFTSVMRSCASVNPAANPRMVITGGDQKISLWHYEITPLRSGRIWPPPLSPRVEVKGSLFSSRNAVAYEIRGTGFATWDHGQVSLLRNFAHCDGRQPIQWSFEYLYPPQDGYEWKAFIQSTAADRTSCMTSGEVIRNGGGPAGSTVDWQTRPNEWASICPNVPDSDWDGMNCGNDCCRMYVPCGAWCNHFCGGIFPYGICTGP